MNEKINLNRVAHSATKAGVQIFIFKYFIDTYFSYYKSNEAVMNAPIQKIDLRGNIINFICLPLFPCFSLVIVIYIKGSICNRLRLQFTDRLHLQAQKYVHQCIICLTLFMIICYFV